MAFLNSCNKATVKENSQRFPGTVFLHGLRRWPVRASSGWAGPSPPWWGFPACPAIWLFFLFHLQCPRLCMVREKLNIFKVTLQREQSDDRCLSVLWSILQTSLFIFLWVCSSSLSIFLEECSPSLTHWRLFWPSWTRDPDLGRRGPELLQPE